MIVSFGKYGGPPYGGEQFSVSTKTKEAKNTTLLKSRNVKYSSIGVSCFVKGPVTKEKEQKRLLIIEI